MSKNKNGSGSNQPKNQNETVKSSASSQNLQEKMQSFNMDNDDQKVKENLKMNSKDIRSHSDGKSGPVSPEAYKLPPELQTGSGASADDESYKAHRKRSRKKGRKNRWFFRGVWLSVLILIGVGMASFCTTCLNDMLAFQKPANEVIVELKKGMSTDQIADILLEKDVIRNKWAFCTYSSVTGSDGFYEYGTFTLSTDMDYEALINKLQASGNTVETVRITFQEGMQVTEIGAKLEEAGVCTQEEFEEAANDKKLFGSYEFIDEIKDEEGRAYFLEGYLFPDTYDFYKNEGATSAIEKMLNNTQLKLDSDIRKKAEKLGMSMDEVITLASMIQAEANGKQDMYNISSIFHNRLDAGVYGGFGYLNSDPTIWYPYESEKDMPSGYEGAYNTYTHVGLPIGPICNPGLSAINAALEPADTNYYYFCHAKDGTAYYAETEAEHENNKALAGIS